MGVIAEMKIKILQMYISALQFVVLILNNELYFSQKM